VTDLELRLSALQVELIDLTEGEFKVLRGADSLLIYDDDIGPIADLVLDEDEDGEPIISIVYSTIAPPNVAAALAVMLESLMPVYVDCDMLFTATKHERNVL
jgi:hypothetical protein